MSDREAIGDAVHALTGAFDALGLLAMPHVFERLVSASSAVEVRAQIAGALRQALDMLAARPTLRGPVSHDRMVAGFSELLAAVSASDAGTLETNAVATARTWLNNLGVPAPPDGWDRYEPPARQ